MIRSFGMKPWLFAVLLAACLNGTGLCAVENPGPAPLLCSEPQAGPCVELLETTHDFGKITMGDVCEHEFKVGNPGNDTLVIENVRVG